MIILDTNVLSEPLKPRPESAVIEWLDAQEPQTLFVTSINLAELLAGIALLPAGRRRTALQLAMAQRIEPLFAGRILNFDTPSAQAFARVNANARAMGNPIGFADCAIAAIAASRGFTLATRNGHDFVGTQIGLIDPWAGVIQKPVRQ